MSPSQYLVWELWDDLFHTVFDIAWCVLVYIQIRFVQRTGRQQHLAWLWPSATACGLTLIYRVFFDIHHVLRTHLPIDGYFRLDLWLEIANIVNMVGSVIFVRMMLADGIFGPVRASKSVDPDSWPPPPSYAESE